MISLEAGLSMSGGRAPFGREEKKSRYFSLARLPSVNHFHVVLRADALLEALIANELGRSHVIFDVYDQTATLRTITTEKCCSITSRGVYIYSSVQI
jgi:hypothetical protein